MTAPSTPPRFTQAKPQPCDACPAITWAQFHDPDDQAKEAAIRADQRRLDMRELQATVRDLVWLIDKLDRNDPTLDKIRRHATRLTTLARRRSAA